MTLFYLRATYILFIHAHPCSICFSSSPGAGEHGQSGFRAEDADDCGLWP